MAPRTDDAMSYGSIQQDNKDAVDETTPLNVPAGDHHEQPSKNSKTTGACIKKYAPRVAVFAILMGLLLKTCTSGWDNTPADTVSTFDVPLSSSFSSTPALSTLSPEDDLFGFPGVDRDDGARPSPIWGNVPGPYPTNSWYLNLVSHRAHHQPDESTRVYTVPYIIDTAAASDSHGIKAGLRVHWPVVQASDRNVQMVYDFKNGLTLGTRDPRVDRHYKVHSDEALSLLGVSLQWSDSSTSTTTTTSNAVDNDDDDDSTTVTKKTTPAGMSTHLVRGMPYATMKYHGGVLPTIHSYNAPASPPLIDGSKELQCGVLHEEADGHGSGGKGVKVEKEIQLHFRNSDFTWALFVSAPVRVTCAVSGGDINVAQFVLNVVSYDEDEVAVPLTARVALLDQCTTGKSDMKKHCLEKAERKDPDAYVKLLRERASIYPSSPQIEFDYPNEQKSLSSADARAVTMTIDWQPRAANGAHGSADKDDLIMFALPHHLNDLNASATEHCFASFHGKSCLVEGASWLLQEDISTPVSFIASRPPEAEAIPDLAASLADDIHYHLSDNLLRAAADTYFSGKILARIGRVIAIASELKNLSAMSLDEATTLYDDVDEEKLLAAMDAASSASLPSDEELTKAIKMLKKGVEVWLSPEAEAAFVYDRSWGGLVNCGCTYVGKGDHGVCNNTFPHCPALADVNEDFGNGFYNDHHFHYGYHIYAAAVAANFDPEWGKKTFDKVLLYVRDIANPTANDKYFTPFRQKDWFLGSSWAAGIVSGENSPHGRNQESSSEAIAGYEGVALYGQVMTDIFSVDDGKDRTQLDTAKLVRDAGKLLTLSEVRAANRYWHVWNSDDHVSAYPAAYTKPVVGMLYQTMASFQTWFAPDAVVSYGIQLMPLTAIGEVRDDPVWATELYPLYKESCVTAGRFCVKNGWSVLQAGLLATTGNRKEALEQALAIPTDVFASLGGNGDSMSNTIWYIATRKPASSSSGKSL